MTDNTDLTNVPQAASVPEKKRTRVPSYGSSRSSPRWSRVGIVVQRYLTEGPTIRISFRAAEGIEAGKTFIKYKDVEIGKVTAVDLIGGLLQDPRHREDGEAARKALLVDDTRFWIVKPRVTLSGVSGIGTLLSGNYIGIEPGKSRKKQRDFVGLESPAVLPRPASRAGSSCCERIPSGSMGIGSPVYYRRLNVGQVIGYDFAADGTVRGNQDLPGRTLRPVRHVGHAVLGDQRHPMRRWGPKRVCPAAPSRCWRSLIAGGIAFETPLSDGLPQPAAANTVFRLFDNRDAALAPPMAESETDSLFYFKRVVARVVGRRAGHLPRDADRRGHGGRPRVRPGDAELRARACRSLDLPVPCSPTALAKTSAATCRRPCTGEERQTSLDRLVAEKGLRAQLRTGSLISGQMYVALDYFPDAPKAKIDRTKEPPGTSRWCRAKWRSSKRSSKTSSRSSTRCRWKRSATT